MDTSRSVWGGRLAAVTSLSTTSITAPSPPVSLSQFIGSRPGTTHEARPRTRAESRLIAGEPRFKPSSPRHHFRRGFLDERARNDPPGVPSVDFVSELVEAFSGRPGLVADDRSFVQEHHPIIAVSFAWPLALELGAGKTRWPQLAGGCDHVSNCSSAESGLDRRLEQRSGRPAFRSATSTSAARVHHWTLADVSGSSRNYQPSWNWRWRRALAKSPN